MRIGIYKPYKKIWWNNWSLDYNVWSREVKNFALMLADKGHIVSLLSSTDYDNSCLKVFKSDGIHFLDVLVVFNGAFSKDKLTEERVLKEFKHAKSVLIASDLDLAMTEHRTELYDVVLTATKQPIFSNAEYGAVQDYHMYKEEQYDGGWEARHHRGIFIGHDRHKEEKFLDYVWRPDIDYFGKAECIRVNKKIPRTEAYDLLKKYTYSIVFFDKRVTDKNFVTARPLELMLHGVIPFIDNEYDKDELQFPMGSWLRVKDYSEFYDKTSNLSKQSFLSLQDVNFQRLQSSLCCKRAYELFEKNVIIDDASKSS